MTFYLVTYFKFEALYTAEKFCKNKILELKNIGFRKKIFLIFEKNNYKLSQKVINFRKNYH